MAASTRIRIRPTWVRDWYVLEHQNFRAAGLVESHRLHRTAD
jgi:hypothetical protein